MRVPIPSRDGALARETPCGTPLAAATGVTTSKLWLSLILVTAAASLGCGNTQVRAPDGGGGSSGAAGQGAGGGGTGGGGAGAAGGNIQPGLCGGAPVSCLPGGPSGTGVECGAGAPTPGSCFEGGWDCGPLVLASTCTCTERSLACPGAVCTPHGWDCPDGGTDADAGPDVPTDGGSCGDGPNPGCWQVVGMATGGLVVCGDYGKNATCVGGQWTCASGEVHGAACNCTQFAPPGCNICTAHGWACPDGGADAPSAG
jgi:hypothetical protein